MIFHTVKAGETLSCIARMYKTTVGAIASTNGIKNPNLIRTGQILKIQLPKDNNTVYNAVVTCLDAIEALPEFKTLLEMLGDTK